MHAMGASMAGRLTQGKFASVLESFGALKSEKCGYFAVIFFFNPVLVHGFYRRVGAVS